MSRSPFDRTGIDPTEIGQVVGGCRRRTCGHERGPQRLARRRSAPEVPATTVDAQCGSSQQATNLAYSMVKSGVVDAAVACGVELMSRVPMGSTAPRASGAPSAKRYWEHYEFTSQFEGAERIAEKWDITRDDTDAFGLRSQQLGAKAWAENANAADRARHGPRSRRGRQGDRRHHHHHQGRRTRDTTLEGLRNLKPVAGGTVYTAGTSSQVSDGAGAVMMMTKEKADELGLTPLAGIVDVNLVGVDPVTMLEGPIDSTKKLLTDNDLSMDDIDVAEIGKAFASVVLARPRNSAPTWTRSTRTVAQSPLVIRSAAPARSSTSRPRTAAR